MTTVANMICPNLVIKMVRKWLSEEWHHHNVSHESTDHRHRENTTQRAKKLKMSKVAVMTWPNRVTEMVKH